MKSYRHIGNKCFGYGSRMVAWRMVGFLLCVFTAGASLAADVAVVVPMRVAVAGLSVVPR